MKNPLLLKKAILERVDFAQVLLDYGVRFTYDPLHSEEVQFHCPFHGVDRKPSARYYRSTQSSYCWYCKKRWDVIRFIEEKEKISFRAALDFIIKKYSVDVSDIPDGPKLISKKRDTPTIQEIELRRALRNILLLRYKIPLEKYALLVVVWYSIAFRSKETDLLKVTEKLNQRAKAILQKVEQQ